MAEEFDDSMNEKEEESSSNNWDFVGRSRIRCLQILIEDKAALFPDDETNVAQVQSDIELMFSIMDELGIRRMRENIFMNIMYDSESFADEDVKNNPESIEKVMKIVDQHPEIPEIDRKRFRESLYSSLPGCMRMAMEDYMKECPEDFEMGESEKETVCNWSCRGKTKIISTGYLESGIPSTTIEIPGYCPFRDDM